MAAEDLEWALHQFEHGTRRSTAYNQYNEYYAGIQRLTFATENFRSVFGNTFKEFAENMCPAVVDSLADRLQITGFKSGSAEIITEDIGTSEFGPARKKITVQDEVGDRAWEIWEKSGMVLKAGEVHEEAIRTGDAYVIVWPDDAMQVKMWPQDASHCRVQYDPNRAGRTLRGLKIWYNEIEKEWHLNVYLPTSIDKFASSSTDATFPTNHSKWSMFEQVPNPWGVVPIFHFANKGLYCHGVSELKDIIPIQDALNKSVCDMLVAMEFAAYKQRYIIGADPELDEETGEPVDQTMKNYGVDRLMAIPDPESKVGQFDATELGQFLRVQDKFWASAAKVSGTPLHYFYITSGDFPSGEAIKSAESRFVKKISDRQEGFGAIWGHLQKFALWVDGTLDFDRDPTGYPLFDDEVVEVLWKDSSPRTESELADTAVKKKAVGVSDSMILKELGYSPEEIERMLEESYAYQAWKAALKAGPDEGGGEGGGEGERDQSTAQLAGRGRGVRR